MTRFTTTGLAVLVALTMALAGGSGVRAQSLATFGVLGGQSVSNTGPSVITGDVGVSPGTAITGFPPGIVVAPYAFHQTDAVANQAQADLTTAYNVLAARPPTQNLTGLDLGGQTLSPGVYAFDDEANLNGVLTLDGLGDPNAVFIFIIGSTLITGSGSSVVLTNGPLNAANVYFVVGSSATLGTTTEFAGRILALTSITLTTGANINCGAALARNGSVTLDTNTILVCPVAAAAFTAVLDATATDNQVAVGQAIDDFDGVLPLGFGVLALLMPDELAAAFSQLSGEAATGVAPTAIGAMNSFLGLLSDRSAIDMGTTPSDQGGNRPGTVRVLGYTDPKTQATDSVFALLDDTPVAALPNTGREAWGAVYGGQTITAGDAGVGSHQRSAHLFGFALGVDYLVGPTGKLGFAASVGGTNFSLSDGLGGGRSTALEAAAYGRQNYDRAYLAGALAFAWHNMTTDRVVTVGGVDRFAARFSAFGIAGEIEAGYRLGSVTPYAAARLQTVFTPAYRETTVSGFPTFALAYDANTTTNLRTELGVKAHHSVALREGATLELRGGVAWAHDYWSDVEATASFQALPGSSFVVRGATPASDSLLVTAGAEIRFQSGVAIAGRFDGEFAQRSRTYAGMGRISYSW